MNSETSKISFRLMKQGEEAYIVELVLAVFSEFVAPDFSDEGIMTFKKFVTEKSIDERFRSGNPVLVALIDNQIIGVIEIRDKCHIALFFVEKSYQKKGVAKKLLYEAIRVCRKTDPGIQNMTVNASPNAYGAYRRLGFKGEKKVKTVNGIRFVPMELGLEK